MKKPYIKKAGTFSGFKIFSVDGKYIRENIEEEFTNFAQHFRFKFIPQDEFWIDKEHGPREIKYFVAHLLTENKLMAKRVPYSRAVAIAERVEKRERNKSEKFIKKIKFKPNSARIKKIHYNLISKYSNSALKVWIVKGKFVRDLFYVDFTEGGHDLVYKFIPKNEIWLDDDVSPLERKFILLHEIHERNLMAKKWSYDKAHASSSKIEYQCRKNRRLLNKFLERELKIAESNSTVA